MARGYAKDQPMGFSNRIEKIAMIGAGGNIGWHIADQLIKKGNHTLTLITRPNSSNKLPEGAKVVRVDYSGTDDTALVEALHGQQALVVTMSMQAPRDTINKLIRAAAKAEVPYILPNWYGHDAGNDSLCKDSMLTQMRDNMCTETKSLGVSSYVLMVSGFWYEFSLGGGPDRYGFDFPTRSFTWFDGGDVPINTTTWPQCGKAVTNLFSLKELPDDENDKSTTLSQFRNSPFYVSSFRITQRDMFESVKRVTKTTDADWTITHESSEQRWKDGMAAVQQGKFQDFTKMLYSRMFFPNGGGDFESKRGLDRDLLGPPEDLDEYTAIGIRMGMNGEVRH